MPGIQAPSSQLPAPVGAATANLCRPSRRNQPGTQYPISLERWAARPHSASHPGPSLPSPWCGGQPSPTGPPAQDPVSFSRMRWSPQPQWASRRGGMASPSEPGCDPVSPLPVQRSARPHVASRGLNGLSRPALLQPSLHPPPFPRLSVSPAALGHLPGSNGLNRLSRRGPNLPSWFRGHPGRTPSSGQVERLQQRARLGPSLPSQVLQSQRSPGPGEGFRLVLPLS